MCNRYSLTPTLGQLTERFSIDRVHVKYSLRYNIAPTQLVPVIRQTGGERCLTEQRWGLMPYWGRGSVHTDRERLKERPYLRAMLARKRCVIPCSGIYVWRPDRNNVLRPWRLVHLDQPAFGMPAIYELWLDSERNEYPMFTLLTAQSREEPGRSAPLLLDEDAMAAWLDPEEMSYDRMFRLLYDIPETPLYAYPVTPLVDNASVEAPECISEWDEALPLVKA